MYLPALTDSELLRLASPVTDLEHELIKRLDHYLSWSVVIERYEDLSPEEAVAQIDGIDELMKDFMCDDLADLRAKVSRGDKVYDMAQEIDGDALSNLGKFLESLK